MKLTFATILAFVAMTVAKPVSDSNGFNHGFTQLI